MLFWAAKPIGPKAPVANASICVLAPPTGTKSLKSRRPPQIGVANV